MKLYDVSIWINVVGKDRMVIGCRDTKLPILPDIGFGILGLYNEPLVVEHLEVDAVSHEINIWCYKVEENRKLSTLLKQFGCGWDWDGFEEVVHDPEEPPPAPNPDPRKPFTNDDLMRVYMERGKAKNLGSDGSSQFTPEDVPPAQEGGPKES